jgi:hypothetical protein
MQWFERVAARRPPDFVVGSTEDPYLKRWWLIPRNSFFNVYLHRFLHSDEDRALHDHPYANVSALLDGAYTEVTIAAGGVERRRVYAVGAVKFRRAATAHRIVLHAGPCWTLFVTGPRLREWGFHCPRGWRRWQDFVSPLGKGQIGRGCDD